MTFPLTIRLHADGTLDEVVCTKATVHLEQMGPASWWLGVHEGKKSVNVWLGIKDGAIVATFETVGDVREERS